MKNLKRPTRSKHIRNPKKRRLFKNRKGWLKNNLFRNPLRRTSPPCRVFDLSGRYKSILDLTIKILLDEKASSTIGDDYVNPGVGLLKTSKFTNGGSVGTNEIIQNDRPHKRRTRIRKGGYLTTQVLQSKTNEDLISGIPKKERDSDEVVFED